MTRSEFPVQELFFKHGSSGKHKHLLNILDAHFPRLDPLGSVLILVTTVISYHFTLVMVILLKRTAHKISCIFLGIFICLNATGPIYSKTFMGSQNRHSSIKRNWWKCVCSQAFRCFLLIRWSLINKLLSLILGHIWRYFLQELTQSRM